MQQLAPSPSQQEWPPHGLTSLWDMFAIRAKLFVMASQSLVQLTTRVEERLRDGDHSSTDTIPRDPMAKLSITGPLIEIADACAKFGAVVTREMADRLLGLVQADILSFRNIAVEVNKINDVFRTELGTVNFYALKPGMAQLIERPQAHFSSEVLRVFPGAAADIDEAGRCYALGRYTACVFHLMRVLEIPLQQLSKSLTPNDKKPNWDPILRKIDAELKQPQKDRTLRGSESFWGNFSAQMHALKIAWRNRVMHVDTVVTEDRATSIFFSTRELMNFLASHPEHFGGENLSA